jgi:putative N-acetylmannosamine-6-phosphate epimerase
VILDIGKLCAPALGDVRTLGQGDALVIAPDATERKDWGRYQDAIGAAVARGVEVHQAAVSRG